jgi:HSP20 family molecular chaperone IbpA
MATSLKTTGNQDVARERSQQAFKQNEAAYVQPPVDIYEDDGGISLLADLPGVSVDGLRVFVEGDTLFVEGSSNLSLPEGTQPVYAEQRSLNFRRRFTLSRDLDTAAIDAKLANGVLKVRIPKTPAAQPRRIEVTAG